MNFRDCVICEGTLEERFFEDALPVCRTCQQGAYWEKYQHHNSQSWVPILVADLRVILASRRLAEADNALPEWEDMWIYSDKMMLVWSAFRDVIMYSREVTNLLNVFIGGD